MPDLPQMPANLPASLTLDHLGFLSENADDDVLVFSGIFPGTFWSPKIVDTIQDVTARFGRTPQGLVYELIQPNSPQSPIARSLKSRKNQINHVCYRCSNLTTSASDLRSQGFFPVTEPRPGRAFGNEPIQFFYHANGLMLELVQGTASPFDLRPE